MWHWFLIVGGVLVGLVLLITFVGFAVPRNHVASRQIRLRQTPETVFDTLTNLDMATSWRKDLKRIERLPDRDGKPVWVETGSFGRMTMQRDVAERPYKIVGRIADETLPFGGTWTYVIKPVAGGSSLTITEDGFIKNPIFRALAHYVFGYTSTMEQVMKSLGRKFGEDVTPGPPTI